jgi:hypothetical protein
VYSDFYKLPLPALCFEKVEEIDIKSEQKSRRKKRRFPDDTQIKRRQRKERRAHFTIHGKDLRIKTAEKTTFTEDTTLPENQKNDTQKQNVSKRFPEWHAEQRRRNRRSQTTTRI